MAEQSLTRLDFKLIQDPIHGPIELHPLLVKIIDTPQFQRLRDIKQLGGVYYVYPGASHNRFEHSIGVCYLAGVFVENIRDKQQELGINERDVLCVKIAALCHDMGHGPFSHIFEDHFKSNVEKEHEDIAGELLEHLVEVNNLYDEFTSHGLNWNTDKKFIKELMTGKSTDLPERKFLYQIVANNTSGVDVDKMDYIARDCHALGVKLNFDSKRYMIICRVIPNDSKEYHICSRRKEIHNLYELFHIRNHLFRIAYKHKTTRAVEFMIADALKEAKEHITIIIPGENHKNVKLSEVTEDMAAFTKLTDNVVHQIKCSTAPELRKSRELLERIDKRELYTFVHSRLLPFQEKAEEYQYPVSIIDIYLKRIARLTNQKLREEAVSKDILRFDYITFNWGKGSQNPMNSLYYYTKEERNKACSFKEDKEISRMFSSVFEEVECRLYSTCKLEEETLRALRESFDEVGHESNDFQDPPLDEEDQSVRTNQLVVSMSYRISATD